jgi:hypothetical protein
VRPGDTAESIAAGIKAEIEALSAARTADMRRVRRGYSRRLRMADGALVVETARQLHHVHGLGWIGFELIRDHPQALALITEKDLEELGQGINSWHSVDAFAGLLAGPAWLRGQVPDELIHRWARSDDLWWRRVALACTVVLNTPSHGGRGDVHRTLEVCSMLVDDHEDMVVKALSWALRRLVAHNPAAVRRFLADHQTVLAARVKREVGNKLRTGLKHPPGRAG